MEDTEGLSHVSVSSGGPFTVLLEVLSSPERPRVLWQAGSLSTLRAWAPLPRASDALCFHLQAPVHALEVPSWHFSTVLRRNEITCVCLIFDFYLESSSRLFVFKLSFVYSFFLIVVKYVQNVLTILKYY